MKDVNCDYLGGTYYGVFPVEIPQNKINVLHARFTEKKREFQRYFLGGWLPTNFTTPQANTFMNNDGASHNFFVITDEETISMLNTLFGKEYVAYGIGGQHTMDNKLAGREGINLFYIDENLKPHRQYFVIDGEHKGVVELRPKCQGRGEFDGQSSIHYSIAYSIPLHHDCCRIGC